MFSLVCISVPPIPITHFSISYHIYSTYVRTVPPIPITHFSITAYAYVHIEATYRSGPPKTSNALQHIHIYSTAGPNPDTEQQQPQIQKKNSNHTYRTQTYGRPGITTLHQLLPPKTRYRVTSTTGPPGPHWPI